MRELSRRGLLALAGAALAAGACRRPVDRRALRLGFFPNLTHAPALAGVASGRFARALAGVRLEPRLFNAGPDAMGALLAGAVDVLYVGPPPALAAYLRTHGRGLHVVAGAASGGAVFVVRPGANLCRARDLRGRRLATPQLGNTQDIALRRYLRAHGLASEEYGGDVRVTPISNPNILTQMKLGHLDGAWVPEPWGARLVAEAGARVFVDERDLWPRGQFATTLVVARAAYAREARANVERLLAAHACEVAWLREDAGAAAEVNRMLASVAGRGLAPRVLRDAWGRVAFTTDPLEDTVAVTARAAQELGLLPRGDLAGLIARSPRPAG